MMSGRSRACCVHRSKAAATKCLSLGTEPEAYARFEADRPDLIITDLAMPEMNGSGSDAAVRRLAQTPIIVLSVRDTEAMKVMALDEGADDYLTKPFSMPELLARVRAHLRRTGGDDPVEEQLEVGDFVSMPLRIPFPFAVHAIHLTPKEFDLLLLFARAPHRVLTHKSLLRAIWGPAGDEQPEYLRVLIAAVTEKDRTWRRAAIHPQRALDWLSFSAGWGSC